MRIRIIVFTFLCFLLNWVGQVCSAENDDRYQVVFSTFERSGAGDYAYLRDSIQTMLASRLAARDRVNVLEKTFSQKELSSLKQGGEQEQVSIGGKELDYLITGSLFSLTTGLNIQVVLYPFSPDSEELRFSIISKTPDSLIADVEKLSQEIAQTAFGYIEGTLEEAGTAKGSAGFVTAHPEAAYKKGYYTGTVVGAEGSGLLAKTRGARRKATLSGEMTAMSVGDANGDGIEEILILFGNNLKLFQLNGRVIQQVAQTNLSQNIIRHAMNMADIDGDGRQEIYISGTDGLYVSSMIMEWTDENGFRIIAENIPWYLRPLLVPGKGWQLAGQQRGMDRNAFVSPGVHLLTLDSNKKVQQGEQLHLPRSINLFDFAYADLDGDDFYELVAVDQKERLKVYNPGNELVWVSTRNFGGSKIYLGPSQGGANDKSKQRNLSPTEDSERELIFVPGKILVTDIDKDGRDEILINENKKAGMSFLNRWRVYNGGIVVGLAWYESALIESWRTGNFRGYVADYSFSLLEEGKGQGQTGNVDTAMSLGRLTVGNLPVSGSWADLLPGTAETGLSVYDVEFYKRKTE